MTESARTLSLLVLVVSCGSVAAESFVGPYKMTFSSADPVAAQAFSIKYLGAIYDQEPFKDGNGHCAFIRWVEFPNTKPNVPHYAMNYAWHFVKGYNYKNGSMTIDEFEDQMAAVHGRMHDFDQFIDFHTTMATDDLDTLAAKLHEDGVPMLVRQYPDGNFSIFVEVPHAIVIEVVGSKLTVLKPQPWARCGTPKRPVVVHEALALHQQARRVNTQKEPFVWPLRAVYPSTVPLEAASFIATQVGGELIRSVDQIAGSMPGSGNGTCYDAQIVRFTSNVGLPYEMWWVHSPRVREGGMGRLKKFEEFLLKLHGNLSNTNNGHYDEYMDFHIGLWYDTGDKLLTRLKANSIPHFLKAQAKSNIPDFFLEGPGGQVYEVQALANLKEEVAMARFNLCQPIIPEPPLTSTMAPAPAKDPTLGCSTGGKELFVNYPAVGYYSGQVRCGSLLMKQDICREPTVRFSAARTDKFYTLMYTSVDSAIDKSWPDNTKDGVVHIHWMVGNLTSSMLQSSANLSADGSLMTKLWPHHGPSPTQRYAFDLMEHDEPTPQPGASKMNLPCFPMHQGLKHEFCTYAQWQTFMNSIPWISVAQNWFVGVFYDDAYRASANSASGGHDVSLLV